MAFMRPERPSAAPGLQAFSGKGMCLESRVADAAAGHARLLGIGAEPASPRGDGPFGPAGVWNDVVEPVAPAAGFRDEGLVGS